MTSRSPSLESVKKSVAAGDLKSAEIELLGLLRENPHATEALHILSKIYVRQQQFDDAIVTLERLSKCLSRWRTARKFGNGFPAGIGDRSSEPAGAQQSWDCLKTKRCLSKSRSGISLRDKHRSGTRPTPQKFGRVKSNAGR